MALGNKRTTEVNRSLHPWMDFPALVGSLMNHIDVICTVKNTSKVFYQFQGESLTPSKIYRIIEQNGVLRYCLPPPMAGFFEFFITPISIITFESPYMKAYLDPI